MTDEQMDARLHRAGEAWRASTAAEPVREAPEVHPLTTPAAPRAPHRRSGLFVSAAVVAAALIAGAGVLVANVTGGGGNKAATTESAELSGTVWELVAVDNTELGSSFSTLYISEDGQLVTDDACTLFGAHVATGGDQLIVSDPQIRYYNCTDSVGELTFNPDVFAANPRYELTAHGLTIRGAGSTLQLVAAPHLSIPTLDRPTLVGATWKLVKATRPDGNEVPIGGNATLRIDNGQLEASDSCNALSGPITVTGSQLDPGNISTTDVACGEVGSVVAAVLTHPARTLLLGTHLSVGLTGAGTLEYEWVPSDTAATNPDKLVDRAWHLISVAGDPVDSRVVLNVHSDGTVTGYDGCREFGEAQGQVGAGTLTVTGLRPGDFSSANCDSELASTVDSLLTQRNALWHIEDGTLVINGPGAQAFGLVFQLPDPNPAPNQPPSLTDIPWQLVAIKDANGTDLPVAGNGSFRVDADGHVTGNDGCNSMTGDVQIDDRTIDFTGGLAVTEMACLDDGVMATAQQVDATLQGLVDWSIDGDRLTLSKDGVGTLIFSAGEVPITSTDPADLIGKTWLLNTTQTGTGPDGSASSANGQLHLRVDAGHVTADTLCNGVDGPLDVGDGTMNLPVPNSVRTCKDTVLEILSGPVTWEITGGRLTITKDGVGALVYVEQAPSSLVGTTWQFSSIETETANSGSGSGTSRPIDLVFDDGNSYRLATGCHAYEGSYTVTGSTISFSDQRDLGGDDCLDTVAQELVEFLDGTMTWSIDGPELSLTNGTTTARFTD